MDKKHISILAAALLLVGALITIPHFADTTARPEQAGIIEESRYPDTEAHREWWLASGGRAAISAEGTISTIQGRLADNDKWRKTYLRTNPLDTENGYYPQNVFRLLSMDRSLDTVQETYFTVNAHNLTESPNRNENSGVFLISRFVNEQEHYYAGLRADGQAVIRKKLDNKYEELALSRVFSGTYDRNVEPSLIPQDTRIGLKLETRTAQNGAVELVLYVDLGTGWSLTARAVDTRRPHNSEGRTGIRADFMDVAFTLKTAE